MLRSRRRLLALAAVALVVLVAYVVWSAYAVATHLRAAEDHYGELTAALGDGDDEAATRIADDLAEDAAAAREGTDGPLWSVAGVLPVIGDDARGVRALTTSLDTIARDAVPQLLDVARDLGGLQADGGIDLAALAALESPLTAARDALASARADIESEDSAGFVGALKPRFDDYADSVISTAGGLDSAVTTIGVLPEMLGDVRPRRYLLVFQNNAEIRATGGMPGNFVELLARDGRLEIVSERDARVYPERTPPLPISAAERAVYDTQLGAWFQDATFTPHFPRAADLMRQRWEEVNRGRRLDGVVSLDPVALSYLLAGTGPVTVDGVTLTPDNAVAALLRDPYVDRSTDEQDAFFGAVAREIFTAATSGIDDPVAFARALGRSASEGRLLVHSFDAAEQETWAGTPAAGELSRDDGTTPHVDIGLNDGTGSKMSYYLRYRADVQASDCRDGTQELAGTLTLNQAITPREAAALPVSVTGGGTSGTTPGEQLVFVRVYGPFGGTMSRLSVDGELIELTDSVDLDGRPVSTVAVNLSSTRDVVVTWDMTTGPGQTGAGQIGLTPSVVPGDNDSEFASAC